MKIAQIVCAFPPYKGGMGNVAFQFSQGLSELKHDVTVFTPEYSRQVNQDGNLDFKIVRMPSFFKIGNAAMLCQINKQLEKGNFDIIHLHYPFFPTSYFVYRFKKKFPQKKFIITYHMDAIGGGLKGLLFTLYSKILMPRILNSADIITAASLDYIENSQAGKVFDNINKFTELPYGVGLDQFKPQEKNKNLMSKLGVQPDDKVILFVGGLDKAHYFKGLESLIKAAELLNSEIKNFKILIIGEGELKEYYINLSEKLGLENKIKFVEVGEYRDLPKYYNLCDLFILPSINSAEAFGLVLTEAMACGKTVLASNLPGVKTVPASNDLLFEPSNSKEMASKIKWLLGDGELRDNFGKEGRRKAEEKYDWNKTIVELEKIYENIQS